MSAGNINLYQNVSIVVQYEYLAPTEVEFYKWGQFLLQTNIPMIPCRQKRVESDFIIFLYNLIVQNRYIRSIFIYCLNFWFSKKQRVIPRELHIDSLPSKSGQIDFSVPKDTQFSGISQLSLCRPLCSHPPSSFDPFFYG